MHRTLLLPACLAAALSLPSVAHATLGEPLTGDDVQAVRIGGHELKLREHAGVKELADAHGKVAAVAWRGFFDLHELLGSHYDEYERALKSAPHGLHFVHVKTADLEVSITSYGALRHGSVTLNHRLPEGVRIDAVR